MKFPPAVALVLGAILAAVEAVQLNVSMSIQAHDAITVATVVLTGLGVMAVTPTQLAKALPHHVLVGLTTALAALGVVQQSGFHLSTAVHTLIGVALVVGAALFTSGGPQTAASVLRR